MRDRTEPGRRPSFAAAPRTGENVRARHRHAGVLVLQRSAGNRAVAAVLPATTPVLQRRLNPPDAAEKPGRLPDEERESVVKLLSASGFTLLERKKARSDPTHKDDLQRRHVQVCGVDDRFNSSTMDPAKRRRLRVELADVYDRLLDAAARYRDDAETAYAAAVETRVDLIRGQTTDTQLFMGGTTIWKASAREPSRRSSRPWPNSSVRGRARGGTPQAATGTARGAPAPTTSLTTTYSLNKHRHLSPQSDLSPTLNYHVNVR